VLGFIKPATDYAKAVMPDVIRHPFPAWIPALAGMTNFGMFDRRSNRLINVAARMLLPQNTRTPEYPAPKLNT
jgi:hypothetical protein